MFVLNVRGIGVVILEVNGVAVIICNSRRRPARRWGSGVTDTKATEEAIVSRRPNTVICTHHKATFEGRMGFGCCASVGQLKILDTGLVAGRAVKGVRGGVGLVSVDALFRSQSTNLW